MFGERDYQGKAIEGIFNEWTKVRSTLIVMPTGTGKTVVFSNVINKSLPKRALVLAHRNELILQAKNKIERIINRRVDVEKAGFYAETNLFGRAQVVVSSIQTQCSGPPGARRYKRFNPKDFSVLVIDEAHRSVSSTYLETIRYYMQNPELKVLGVSATPKRTDEEALNQIYESVAFRYGVVEAIEEGWLVNIVQKYVKVKSLDFSHVKTSDGDLDKGDLSALMEKGEIVLGVCQPTIEAMHRLPEHSLDTIPVPQWREHLKSLNETPFKTLVFTVSVAQAKLCCDLMSGALDGVEWICGKTRTEDRAEILNNFKTGKTKVLVNCSVLTEGFDEPGIELISVARPTKSRVLYTQIIGRGTRPLPGIVDGLEDAEKRKASIASSAKQYIRVLDFVGNSGKHKLISIPDVLGGNVSDRVIERVKKMTLDADPKNGKLILNTIKNAEKAIRDEDVKKARLEEDRRNKKFLPKAHYSAQEVSPFGYNHSYIPVANTHSKEGRQFSEPQLKVLRLAGVNPANVTYRQGQTIIGKQIQKWKDEKKKAA
jgi:superfamily II DNA or RNA helicase